MHKWRIATLVLASGFALVASCAREAARCERNDQCGPVLVCSEGACISPCEEDSVCGGQAICVESKCVPGCREDDHCDLGQICAELQCVNGCTHRSRCQHYQYCSDEGQCLDGCGRDGDCGPGQFCESNKCVPIGGADAGPPPCTGHDACRVGEFCAPDGRCRVGCRPGRCPGNQTCDEETGRCSGQQPPRVDAGPVADVGAEDAGPSVAFDAICTLSVGGGATTRLTVLQGAVASVALSPEFDAEINWAVVQAPGQASSVIWGDVEGRNQPVRFKRVGGYTLRATATYQGVSETCDLDVVSMAPASGYWLELSWDGDRNLDLHMTPVPDQETCEEDRQCAQNQLGRSECNLGFCSRPFASRDGRDGDCWMRNPNPLWGDPNDVQTNPHHLGDADRGAGTENIVVDSLILGWTQRVAIRMWGNEPNTARLKIFHDGEAVYTSPELRLGPAEAAPWFYLGHLRDVPGPSPFSEVMQLSPGTPRQ